METKLRDPVSAGAMVDVGVVVPVWNRAGTVLRTLRAVANQTAPPRRVVVVDDGSTDGTPEAVEAWLAGRGRTGDWRVVRMEHRGPAAARNRGFREVSDCQHVAFLDSDDLWPRRFLERAERRLRADAELVAVSGDRRMVDVRSGRVRHDDLRDVERNATRWIFARDAGIASATVLRKETVNAAGGFDESLPLWEDGKFFLAVSLFGPWGHVAGAEVTFTESASASRGETGNLKRARSDRQARWARMREEVLQVPGYAERLPAAVVRRTLTHRWRQAARECVRRRDWVGCWRCLRRSAAWRRGAVWQGESQGDLKAV